MRDQRASVTAAFVAVCRGLGPLLPSRFQLVDDALGARFGGEAIGAVGARALRARGVARVAVQGASLPLLPWVFYMQVRTRVIDDALRAFVAGGGRQVVVLGAGFDTRAARLGDVLEGVRVIEVDHPATQARKRAVLAEAGVVSKAQYLAWHFEDDPMSALPAALSGQGLDREAATFTIWEGVTMYLTEAALSASVEAIAAYSGTGSELAFNYLREAFVTRPGVLSAVVGGVVKAVGEPFRSGFTPEGLRPWMASRGFVVRRDEDFAEVASRLLGGEWGWLVRKGRRFAVAERSAVAERVGESSGAS